MKAEDILLKFLKAKHYIEDIEKARKEVVAAKVILRKETDLFIRDAITGIGTILEENLELHYYITTVKTGVFGNVLTQAIILRSDQEAQIVVHAHEGLIKQHLGEKTIQKLKLKLEQSHR